MNAMDRLFRRRATAERYCECRRCGETVSETVERCPNCGTTTIARYDIE